jgi:hypothetical protein
MTTQQLYQKVINEQMTPQEFLWNVRRDLRVNGILTNTMSYEDTVGLLKSKGYIWENVKGEEVAKLDFLGSFKALNEANKLKGGKGDKLTADHVNYHEFTKGWKHELEHTDDIDKAKEIALDHLEEDPNYYTRLDMIEYQAKKEKKQATPKEVSKTNLKDKENQMTSPKGVKKEKANVGRKKEKAKKVTGVKTMKGGSEAPKTIKEGKDESLKYDKNQVYMWKKNMKSPEMKKLDSSVFIRLMKDDNITDLEIYDKNRFDALRKEYENELKRFLDRKAAKDNAKDNDIKPSAPIKKINNQGPKADRIPTSPAKAPDGKLSDYYILKGPGAGSKRSVKMTDGQVSKWKEKYGDDSLESAASGLSVGSKYGATPSEKPIPKSDPQTKNDSKPLNLGQKDEPKTKVTQTKSEPGEYRFYLVNEKDKTIKGFDDVKSARSEQKSGDKIVNPVGYGGFINKGYTDVTKIKENIIKKAKDKLFKKSDSKKALDAVEEKIIGKPISFTISGTKKDPDYKEGISKITIKAVSFDENKQRLNVELSNGGHIIFIQKNNESKEVAGIYTDKDKKSSPIGSLNKPTEFINMAIDAVFGKDDPEQKPADAPMNEALANYIRQRIRAILKEGYNEEGGYPGVAGPDVVKKKLNHVMQTYDWGYKDSQDPFIRDNGNQKNSLAAKLIADLGPDGDGIAIFNSYAPEGFEIQTIEDLGGYAGGAMGGMPQDRAFNPDKLTARGGRLAEDEDQQYKKELIQNIQKVPLPELIKKFMVDEYKGIEKLAAIKIIQNMLSTGDIEKSIPAGIELTKLIDKLPDNK